MRARHETRPMFCAVALCLLLAGCDRSADDATASAEATADTVADDPIFRAAELETLPESRIYRTLTDHGWYARGEPLQHEGVPYVARGAPVAATLSEMEPLGEYEGVEYYSRGDDIGGVVYVPVFEGYWQPFLAEPQPARGD